MELRFRTQADATDFEQVILKLSLPPVFEWSTGPNMNYVYNIEDTEPNPKEYKGILLQHTRMNWKYSEFFFMFRDGDYQYNRERLSIWLPNLYYPNYVSTHVDKLFQPDPAKPVRFSHCEKKIGNCPIEFEDEAISQKFMSALTPNHQLLFSRRITFLNNKKPTTKFWNQGGWQSKGPTEIQIWRKGSGFRLLSRWATEKADKDRWVTMSLPRTGIDMLQKGSNLAVLPVREYERGRKIDMANLVARDARDPHKDKLQASFTISFETFKGKFWIRVFRVLHRMLTRYPRSRRICRFGKWPSTRYPGRSLWYGMMMTCRVWIDDEGAGMAGFISEALSLYYTFQDLVVLLYDRDTSMWGGGDLGAIMVMISFAIIRNLKYEVSPSDLSTSSFESLL